VKVPFHRPSVGPTEIDRVVDVLRSGWLTAGPETKEFEKRFAAFVGRRCAVGLNSCTAALALALECCGVGSGDEVIVSPVTFASAANVIVHRGARPVFVDVEPETLNMDPDVIEAAVTERTRAVIPVHFAGTPCDMDRICAVAAASGVSVIADCAHAIETQYKGRNVGCWGDAACYSFYATKNMTTGEGGMLLSDDDEFGQHAALLSLHGMTCDAWRRRGEEGYRHWDILEAGYKYNMFDIQAALGIAQLARMGEFSARRREICAFYDAAFCRMPQLRLLRTPDYGESARHLYVLLLLVENLTRDRDWIMNELGRRGVGIGIHFRAVHLHTFYRERFGFSRGLCPEAEYASDRVISLPLFPAMTDGQVEYVIRTVKAVIRECS